MTHVFDPLRLRSLEPLPNKNAIRLIPEPVEPLPQLDRREARRVLGVPTDGRYLAFMGGVDPRKGVELFVSAFARAKLADHDRLLFVGRMADRSANGCIASTITCCDKVESCWSIVM